MRDKQKTIKMLDTELKEKAAQTDARLDSVEQTIFKLDANISSGFEEMRDLAKSFKTLAKNSPHVITKDGTFGADVYEHCDENGIEFEKNADPMADVEVVRHGISSVAGLEFKNKAEQMRFDNELIEIMVMPSQSQFPDHTFTIGVNGRLILIVRGTKQWVPRNYVEVLLRAKVSTYGNFERRNEYNGELEVQHPETKSHRYPLQVITDKNPKGSAWLVRVTNDVGA